MIISRSLSMKIRFRKENNAIMMDVDLINYFNTKQNSRK